MSDDFLVTHICSECSKVWLYGEEFKGACPKCGTTKEPVAVDRLAGRRERAARGEPVEPLVMVPDKRTTLHTQFVEGIRELRKLIAQIEEEISDLDYTKPSDTKSVLAPATEATYTHASSLNRALGRLKKAERGVSALLILAGDAEGYAAGMADPNATVQTVDMMKMVTRADASAWAAGVSPQPKTLVGEPCPYCKTGTLKAAGNVPIYLVCDDCGTSFVKDEQPDATFTGKLMAHGAAIHQHISERRDEAIAKKIKDASGAWRIPEVDK